MMRGLFIRVSRRRGWRWFVTCRPCPGTREVQLREPVKGRRGEGRQPDDVRLSLFGEVPLQTVRSLDEPIVLSVEADQRNGQPSPHRRMPVLLGAEVAPLRMCPELLVGQPDRPTDLVGLRMDPVSHGRLLVVSPLGVLL